MSDLASRVAKLENRAGHRDAMYLWFAFAVPGSGDLIGRTGPPSWAWTWEIVPDGRELLAQARVAGDLIVKVTSGIDPGDL